MKRIHLIYGVLACLMLPLSPVAAQTGLQAALEEIERNNTFLQAARDAGEAENVANRTGLNLPDPEIGFAHSWYTKGSNLREKEFSVTQELDWAVITGQRKRVSRQKNELVALQYVQERNAVRLAALEELIGLVYANGWLQELKIRQSDARELADAYEAMLEQGSTNVVEVNRARLNLVTVTAEVARAEADREETLSRIKALNGGKSLTQSVEGYGLSALPSDFEAWRAAAESVNPQLQYVRQTAELSERELKMARTEYIPNIAVGYAMEQSPEEGKHGVTLGLRIPLWQDRNKVKQGKAALVAAQSEAADAYVQFMSEVEACYERAQALRRVADDCSRNFAMLDTRNLLHDALMAGQINVLDYVTELGQYYQAREQVLSAERDYQLAYIRLQSYVWN